MTDPTQEVVAKTCATCRWWDIHSITGKVGDCKHKTGDMPHRAWSAPGIRMDSFGFETTKATETCSFHEPGKDTNDEG